MFGRRTHIAQTGEVWRKKARVWLLLSLLVTVACQRASAPSAGPSAQAPPQAITPTATSAAPTDQPALPGAGTIAATPAAPAGNVARPQEAASPLPIAPSPTPAPAPPTLAPTPAVFTPAPNQPPEIVGAIKATPDKLSSLGKAQLQAVARDPDGDALTFSWFQLPVQPAGQFSTTTSDSPTWTAPSVSQPSNFALLVIVSDALGNQVKGSAVVEVVPAPTVQAAAPSPTTTPAPVPAPAPTPTTTTPPTPTPAAKAVEVSSVQFQKFTSPQGRFEVMIPKGWRFEKIAVDESFFRFSPPSDTLPAVAIGFTEGTTLANYLGLLYGGYPYEMPAKDFLEQLWLPYMKQTYSNVKLELVSGTQKNQGELVFSMTDKGRNSRIKTAAYMEYLPNPPTGSIYSFAVLNFTAYDIDASAAERQKMDAIAGEIFSSFKPNETWGQEMATEISKGLIAQGGRVRDSMRRLNGLEMNMRMQEFGGATKTQRGWADALGGTTELHDSSGNTYRTSDQYNYYYEQGGRVYGTNNPSEVSGQNQLAR